MKISFKEDNTSNITLIIDIKFNDLTFELAEKIVLENEGIADGYVQDVTGQTKHIIDVVSRFGINNIWDEYRDEHIFIGTESPEEYEQRIAAERAECDEDMYWKEVRKGEREDDGSFGEAPLYMKQHLINNDYIDDAVYRIKEYFVPGGNVPLEDIYGEFEIWRAKSVKTAIIEIFANDENEEANILNSQIEQKFDENVQSTYWVIEVPYVENDAEPGDKMIYIAEKHDETKRKFHLNRSL